MAVADFSLPGPQAGPGPAAGNPYLVVAGGWSLWIFDAGLACCAVECAAALRHMPGAGPAGAGGEGAPAVGAGGTSLNVLIVAGTVTDKLAPLVLRAYQDLPEPRRVMSFGACSNCGGPYWDSYCVTKGVDQILPVDVYVPGCPPRPEALLRCLDLLASGGTAEGGTGDGRGRG